MLTLAAVRQAARQSKSVRFTALLHHINIDLLKRSYLALTRDAAPGIDGVTWQAYGESLEEKLKDLHDRVHRGSYRARPARRTYIPKADGSERPLSILCLEDKIVQQAVVFVLDNPLYTKRFASITCGPGVPARLSWASMYCTLSAGAAGGRRSRRWRRNWRWTGTRSRRWTVADDDPVGVPFADRYLVDADAEFGS